MSFLGSLFNRNNNAGSAGDGSAKEELLKEVAVAPDLVLPQALAYHFPEIQKTAKQTVIIKAEPSEQLSIRQSKFGHYPCLPKGFAYPKDARGNYLYPLAQINFNEVPALENFPRSGYLQFYIGNDDTYGLNFDEKHPDNFTVLFFENFEVESPEEDLSFLDEVLRSECSPVYKPHALTFQHKIEYVGLEDLQAAERAYFDLYQIIEQFPAIEKELETAIYNVFSPNGHKLGGYAYFTQSDPRDCDSKIKDYVLLFQIDSDDHIMWGDVGVANFFIDREDLAKKNFSKVFYTWDCC